MDATTPAASAGTANFSRYIAVGNSLTAGYEDGGLYLDGQNNSYPSILAGQFALAGGGAFTQPLFTTAQSNGSGYLKLTGFMADGTPITTNVTTNLAVRSASPQVLYTKYTDAINNLGVPGIRMSDIQTPGYGSQLGNPYFERITPDANPYQTYLQRVKAEVATATFFTCWLGNNDVLGYATSGGALGALSPTYAITRPDTFNLKAQRVINALTANNAKGVVSNIPDVTGIPFFTTVGASARAKFAANNVPVSLAPFVYTTGTLAPLQPNTRVATTLSSIRDASGNGNLLLTLTAAPYIGLYGQPTGKYWRDFYAQARPVLPATIPNLGVFLLTLGVDTTKAFGASTGNPFPSTLVLDATEQTAVSTATTAFNASLQNAANAKGLAYFDANAYFRGIANNGVVTNAVSNSASYIAGNLFSLDGVHPTPRGYALVANQIIQVINTQYGATIPQVNANNYRGVLFP
ncbi:SGNH/GDSL hydrolase family protein [Hymenobacter sp. BRD67]|uniref:SGNH/GDSL hydrolase family protein n=1 Tax=Hymenobacter sp. BRD67 TaxID=2675877 RepID=UPI0020B8B94A|nr:SGNH/GDSL hydrolase family protein [Hymenobacter sp. BRD67]